MASVLILIVVVVALLIFQRFGLIARFPLSWNLVCRIFIYILLILGALGFLAKVWSIIVVLAHLNPAWLVSPSGDPLIDIVSTITYALALWGIWRWKKWGAYLIFVRLAFTMAVQIFVYHSLGWHLAAGYTGLDNLYADLMGGATWLLGLFFTWKYFK
jgi:hypothetical protein